MQRNTMTPTSRPLTDQQTTSKHSNKIHCIKRKSILFLCVCECAIVVMRLKERGQREGIVISFLFSLLTTNQDLEIIRTRQKQQGNRQKAANVSSLYKLPSLPPRISSDRVSTFPSLPNPRASPAPSPPCPLPVKREKEKLEHLKALTARKVTHKQRQTQYQ